VKLNIVAKMMSDIIKEGDARAEKQALKEIKKMRKDGKADKDIRKYLAPFLPSKLISELLKR